MTMKELLVGELRVIAGSKESKFSGFDWDNGKAIFRTVKNGEKWDMSLELVISNIVI